MKGVMIQGTASDVGKSLLATALCRILHEEGYQVAPFKSQNMSNNSYVTIDGKEIGRAQGLQAEAAGIEATAYMNPILLKPSGNGGSEVVLLGQRLAFFEGMEYRKHFYEHAITTIKESLKVLEKEYDYLIIEGAGSPVEINLKDREVVNMRVAELADVPVILVADINRGGVFASIVGTLALLSEEERKRVKGLIINKFRGKAELFAEGRTWLEEYTGIPVLGIIPYFPNHMIEGEDSLSIMERFTAKGKKDLEIAAVHLPYVSNYSDLEPFLYEEDVSVRWVDQAADFGNPDAVVLPGTKSTFHDLQHIKGNGLAEAIRQFAENGGTVIGICGGYQMLGERLVDTAGSDTGISGREEAGLGLIPATTYFKDEKRTVRVEGEFRPVHRDGSVALSGYEIHLGETKLSRKENMKPFLTLNDGASEGCYVNEGQLIGTYMHHVFHNDEWRSEWLNRLRQQKGIAARSPVYLEVKKEQQYRELGEFVRKHLNMEKFLNIIEEVKKETI